MVPVLGFVAWTMVGVFGLGARDAGVHAAYRRENPAPSARRTSRVRRAAAPPLDAARAASIAARRGVRALGPFMPRTLSPAPRGGLGPRVVPHAAFRDRLAAFVLDVILVVIAQQLLDLDQSRQRDLPAAARAITSGSGRGRARRSAGSSASSAWCEWTARRCASSMRWCAASRASSRWRCVGLGALWILKDPERQAWHDKIAGTYVVKVPRNWPL